MTPEQLESGEWFNYSHSLEIIYIEHVFKKIIEKTIEVNFRGKNIHLLF